MSAPKQEGLSMEQLTAMEAELAEGGKAENL